MLSFKQRSINQNDEDRMYDTKLGHYYNAIRIHFDQNETQIALNLLSTLLIFMKDFSVEKKISVLESCLGLMWQKEDEINSRLSKINKELEDKEEVDSIIMPSAFMKVSASGSKFWQLSPNNFRQKIVDEQDKKIVGKTSVRNRLFSSLTTITNKKLLIDPIIRRNIPGRK